MTLKKVVPSTVNQGPEGLVDTRVAVTVCARLRGLNAAAVRRRTHSDKKLVRVFVMAKYSLAAGAAAIRAPAAFSQIAV
jgi:hypothetical protein